MSGFRKFRSSLHRRRRSLEAMELGHLVSGGNVEAGAMTGPVPPSTPPRAYEGEASPLEFSPSAEALEIGPAPIAWLKSRRSETDN